MLSVLVWQNIKNSVTYEICTNLWTDGSHSFGFFRENSLIPVSYGGIMLTERQAMIRMVLLPKAVTMVKTMADSYHSV